MIKFVVQSRPKQILQPKKKMEENSYPAPGDGPMPAPKIRRPKIDANRNIHEELEKVLMASGIAKKDKKGVEPNRKLRENTNKISKKHPCLNPHPYPPPPLKLATPCTQ